MIVGNRPSKENIDCFILSDNFDATSKNVETFDVDKTVLDHNPIGVTLIFKEIKVLKTYYFLTINVTERRSNFGIEDCFALNCNLMYCPISHEIKSRGKGRII